MPGSEIALWGLKDSKQLGCRFSVGAAETSQHGMRHYGERPGWDGYRPEGCSNLDAY